MDSKRSVLQGERRQAWMESKVAIRNGEFIAPRRARRFATSWAGPVTCDHVTRTSDELRTRPKQSSNRQPHRQKQQHSAGRGEKDSDSGIPLVDHQASQKESAGQ